MAFEGTKKIPTWTSFCSVDLPTLMKQEANSKATLQTCTIAIAYIAGINYSSRTFRPFLLFVTLVLTVPEVDFFL